MQVFNAYFKVMRKHIRPIILFFALFVGISIMITAQLAGSGEGFTKVKTKIALFNDDAGMALADGLEEYIQDNANIIAVPDDEEKILDALFYGNIYYVLRIPQGFTESFLSGDAGAVLEKIEGSDEIHNVNMDLLINRYMNLAAIYAANLPGADAAQIVDNILGDIAQGAELQMNEQNGAQEMNYISYYFQYLAYSIMGIMIMGVTSFMMAMNNGDIINRNQCSPVRPVSMNMQIVLGNVVFSIVVWLALCATVFILNKGIPNVTATLLLCLNALALIIVSLSIGFLVGKFVKSSGVQNAIVNVVALGSSFLCGVFVEQELLGETVLNFAHFLPTYWYIKAIRDIRGIGVFTLDHMLPVIYSMLIQLGFAAVILIVALVLSKQKKAQSLA